MSWRKMTVHYVESNCTQYREDTQPDEIDALESQTFVIPKASYYPRYNEGDCQMGTDVHCTLHEPMASKCRLNVRMSAAFVLMSCLVIKAVYMCIVNLLARGKVKEHCLTFGDVIVASAANPELRVQGYVVLSVCRISS
jgi:hypothetical protein